MTEGSAWFTVSLWQNKCWCHRLWNNNYLNTARQKDWHRLAQGFERILRNLSTLSKFRNNIVTHFIPTLKPVIKTKHLTHCWLVWWYSSSCLRIFHCDLWCLGVQRGPINKHCFLFSGWVTETFAQKPLTALCVTSAHTQNHNLSFCALALDLSVRACVDVLRQLWLT